MNKFVIFSLGFVVGASAGFVFGVKQTIESYEEDQKDAR